MGLTPRDWSGLLSRVATPGTTRPCLPQGGFLPLDLSASLPPEFCPLFFVCFLCGTWHGIFMRNHCKLEEFINCDLIRISERYYSVPRKSPKLFFKPCCRTSVPLRRIISFRTFGVSPGKENDSWKSAVNKNSKQVKFLAAVHHRVSLDEISGILIFHHVPRIFDSAQS